MAHQTKDDTVVASIDIPEDAWDANGAIADGVPDHARLYACIRINGILLHIEAIEVTTDGGGLQRAAHGAWESTLTALYDAAGPDEPFETTEIRGREYVVYGVPSS